VIRAAAHPRIAEERTRDAPPRAASSRVWGGVPPSRAWCLAILVAGQASAQDVLPLPKGLVWICAYSDEATECSDLVFSTDTLTDCGNANPLEAYKGGRGTLFFSGPAGERLQYSYGSRSYNVRGGPGNLDAIKLFPDGTPEFPVVGDFETCLTYVRP
jgi:hypothetical protein